MSWTWVSPPVWFAAGEWRSSISAPGLAMGLGWWATALGFLPGPHPHFQWASGSVSLWALRMAQLGLWKGASGGGQQSGRCQAGLHQGAPRLHFLWARAWCLPRAGAGGGGGGLHKPSCAGPRLPSRLACAPACLSCWLLPPSRGWHPCSQSCSLDCVSITTGLARGLPDTRARPPIPGRVLLLPHFAADSSPKQNRLSPFPPSGSSSLACGCLLSRCRRCRPERGALGQPCRDWDGVPGSWP